MPFAVAFTVGCCVIVGEIFIGCPFGEVTVFVVGVLTAGTVVAPGVVTGVVTGISDVVGVTGVVTAGVSVLAFSSLLPQLTAITRNKTATIEYILFMINRFDF
jgi:hypothetical protein